MTAGEILMLIGAVFAGIGAIIFAIYFTFGIEEADINLGVLPFGCMIACWLVGGCLLCIGI